MKRNKKYSKILRINKAKKYGKFKYFYKNGEFWETRLNPLKSGHVRSIL